MEKTALVKMKKKMNIAELAGEKVMVDFQTGKYFMIKGIGNDVWDMLGEKEIRVSDVIAKILEEYEVDEATCTKEVLEFLEQLQARDIVEVR